MEVSDLLKKMSNIVLASKLTSFLKPQCDEYLIQTVYNKKTFEQLTQQEQKQLSSQTAKIVDNIQKTSMEIGQLLGTKNITKQFIIQIKKLIQNDGNNIFNEVQLNICKSIIKDFVEYKQYIDPKYSNIFNLNRLSELSQIILNFKKKQAQNEKTIADFKKIMQYGEYIVLKFDDEDQEKAVEWLKPRKEIRWCVIKNGHGFWANYGAPYYLILKGYVPYMLVNFNSAQFKTVDNARIKQQAIDKDIVKITNELSGKYNGDYLYNGDFAVLTPYYPIDAIVKGIENNKITKNQLDLIIQNTLKTDDLQKINKLIDVLQKQGKDLSEFMKNVSNEKQYRFIASKIFQNTNNAKEEQFLKQSVQLNKTDLIQMIFNAFGSGKKGLPLFRRLMKFKPSEQNINTYVQGEQYNAEFLQIGYNGKTLLNSICVLNQLQQLNEIYKQINGSQLKLDKQQAKIMFENACSQSNVDKPTINFLLQHKLVQLNSELVYVVMKSGKDTIIKMVLDASDNNLFNQPLYGDTLPTFYCILNNMPRILSLLLSSNKVDANATNKKGIDLLWFAIQSDKDQVIKSIIETVKGINFNKIYPVGVCANNTIFSYCVTNNKNDIGNLLLSNNNVDVNINNPIDYAIINNKTEIVRKIINHTKFDPYSKDNDGNTPIMVALQNDNTFGMFKLIANKIGKTNLSKADLVNTKTQMTPLMLAVDNDMPFDLLSQYFDNKSISYSNKKSKNVYDIVLNKLSIKPNDENMLKIKSWIQAQNKTKIKKKQIDLEEQLKTLAYRGNESEFKQLLNQHSEEFDFSKKINGVNLIYLFSTNSSTTNCLKLLLDFISSSSKYNGYLKDLLEQQFNGGFNAYDDASSKNKVILKPYYDKANIKVASDNFKKIFAFVKKFLS